MKMKVISCATCALVMGTGSQALAGDTVIGTLDVWDGVSQVTSFGDPNTATYGQTFLAADNFMTSFTFFINDSVNPDFVQFEAFVYAWDVGLGRATGPALFSSSAMATTNNGGADGMEQFTINMGNNVAVTPGDTYVAFFSASNLFDGNPGTSAWGLVGNDYDGGTFVFMNNGNNFNQLFEQTWSNFSSDLAFEMTFHDVPAPAALAIFGIAGLSMGRRRRK